jgi:uncharacterized protein (TIGR03435 family)
MGMVGRVGLLVMLAGMVVAQPGPSAKPVAFEVVSVKEHHGDDGMMRWQSTPDGISMTNLHLVNLLMSGYGLNNSTEDHVVGLPGWAKTQGFDIQAKVAEEDLAAYKALDRKGKNAVLRAMLDERFKVVAHVEVREQPVYYLLLAKGGTKLVDGAAPGAGSKVAEMKGGGYMTSDGEVDANGIAIEGLVSMLTGQTERKVIDKTGLKGKYSFTLKWTPDAEAGSATGDDAKVGLLTALEEQLGLKLEAGKGPVEYLIVDHVEKPSAN